MLELYIYIYIYLYYRSNIFILKLIWQFSCHTALKSYQENFQLMDIIYYSPFSMGGNTLLKKNLSAWLAKENILALGKWLREYFKVGLTPRWAFLQLSQCCHKKYFSWTKHSKTGVHTEFPQSFLLWSLPALTPRQMMVRLLLTEKGSEALSFIEARQAGLGSHTSLVGMQVAEL